MASAPPDGPLAGRVCVITGGTQGLGEATAHAMRAGGASGLLISGRHAERGRAVRAALVDSDCDAHFVQADLAEPDDCRAVIQAADDLFGRVDVLVNAAGSTKRGTILDTAVPDLAEVFAINVQAPFLLMQGAIAIMLREHIAGSIVNVSSVVATGGAPYLCGYSASKAALDALTKNVAYSVMRHRIRVNAVSPGWIDTPGEHATRMTFHNASADWLQDAEAEQPFHRLIKPEELARMIAFLAGSESGVMTGSIVHFDQTVPGAGDPPQPSWEETISAPEGAAANPLGSVR